MYQNQGARINTRVGQGDAVAWQSRPDDLSAFGAKDGENSIGGQKRKVSNALQEVDDYDHQGLLLFQSENIGRMRDDLVEWSREHVGEEGFEDELSKRARDLRTYYEQSNSVAEQFNKSYNTIRRDDPNNYEGLEGLEGAIDNPNYGISPKTGELDLTEGNTRLLSALDGVRKKENFDPQSMLPEMPLDIIGNTDVKGGRQISTKRFAYNEDRLDKIRSTATNIIKSGLAQLSEAEGVQPNPQDIKMVEFLTNRVLSDSQNVSEYNALGAKEDRDKWMLDKATDIFVGLTEEKNRKSGDSFNSLPYKGNSQKQKQIKPKFTESQIAEGRKVKEDVAAFQSSRKLDSISPYLSANNITAALDGDTVTFYKNGVNGSIQASSPIRIDDAESIYTFIANKNKHINREAIDLAEFNGEGGNEYGDRVQKAKNLTGQIINFEKLANKESFNSVANKIKGLFGDDVKIKKGSDYTDAVITIDGQEYDIHDGNADEAKEAYELLQKKILDKKLENKNPFNTNLENKTSSTENSEENLTPAQRMEKLKEKIKGNK